MKSNTTQRRSSLLQDLLQVVGANTAVIAVRSWCAAHKPLVRILYALIFVVVPTVLGYVQCLHREPASAHLRIAGLLDAAERYHSDGQHNLALSRLTEAKKCDPANVDVDYNLARELQCLAQNGPSNDLLLGIMDDIDGGHIPFMIALNYIELGDWANGERYMSLANVRYHNHSDDRMAIIAQATGLGCDVANFDNGDISAYDNYLKSELASASQGITLNAGSAVPRAKMTDDIMHRFAMRAALYMMYSTGGRALAAEERSNESLWCTMESIEYIPQAYAPGLVMDFAAVLVNASVLLAAHDSNSQTTTDFGRLATSIRRVANGKRDAATDDCAWILYFGYCQPDTAVTIHTDDFALRYTAKVNVNRTGKLMARVLPPRAIGAERTLAFESGSKLDILFPLVPGTQLSTGLDATVEVGDGVTTSSFVLKPYIWRLDRSRH